jgi:hypothetical protein
MLNAGDSSLCGEGGKAGMKRRHAKRNTHRERSCKQGGPSSDSLLLAENGYFPKPTFEKFRKNCPVNRWARGEAESKRTRTSRSTAMRRDRWAYRY